MTNVRKLAVLALLKVEQDGAYSNLTLNSLLKDNPQLSRQEKAFSVKLFYGVLDRKITLDYYISKLIKTPVSKIKPYTLCVLRSAMYQIKYLDSVPESAVVNEAVKLMKNSREAYQSGFVNAVLRNFLRDEISLPQGESVYDLSVRYSCPEWITGSFVKDYGAETAVLLLEEALKTPPVYLRVNTLKIQKNTLLDLLKQQGINALDVEGENALCIYDGIDVSKNDSFKKGYFHVQDLSSQLCAKLLSAKPGEKVLDICSAPGGKAFTIAQYMENKGSLIACDLYDHRTSLITQGADRLGIDIIKTKTLDATKPLPFDKCFDAVLCDVPCSGLGIIRRKPDIKYNAVADYKELSLIQSQILNNAAACVKKGGRLVYSTCTLRKGENRKAVDKFLMNNSSFELIQDYTYMPHIDGTDGFYTALLVSR